MRTLKKVLGWVVTVLVILAFGAFLTAGEILKQELDLPDAVAWVLVGLLAGPGLVLIGLDILRRMRSQARVARRLERERQRELLRRLKNFELD